MKLWMVLALLVVVLSGGLASGFTLVMVGRDDWEIFSAAPAIAEYKGDDQYLLDFGGGNKTMLDSMRYVRYLEGIIEHLSSEIDSLKTDDRYVAVIMTTEANPEIIGRMGLRLPEGAQIKYSEGLLSGSWQQFPVSLYLDNRISILGQPEAPAIKFGVVAFRFPKGEFPPNVEEIVPLGVTYRITLTKAY